MKLSRVLGPVIGARSLMTGVCAVAGPADDAALAAAVKAKLADKDPEFLRAGTVEISSGVVTLRGAGLMPATVFKALQVSGSVPGVLRVVNRAVAR